MDRALHEITFCVIDIETTGPYAKTASLLEIAALKFKFFETLLGTPDPKNPLKFGRITESFQTLVFAPKIPEVIQKLTGITPETVRHAPLESTALTAFVDFLADDIFVAHNVIFDYGFLNEKMLFYGFNALKNLQICTHKNARRHILGQKTALGFLNENLGLGAKTLHRAYDDALCAAKIFEISSLPARLKSKNFDEFMINLKQKAKNDAPKTKRKNHTVLPAISR